MSLTRAEKSELVLIGAAVLLTWLVMGEQTWTPPVSELVGGIAAVLLGQGFLRDLARLVVLNRKKPEEQRRLACLCAESTIGLVLIGMAASLSLIGLTETVTLGHTGLAVLIGLVLGGGFIAKDYVVIVRKEKDHGSVIMW